MTRRLRLLAALLVGSVVLTGCDFDVYKLPLPGGQLRYVQCPQAPFNNSDEQNVCAGL